MVDLGFAVDDGWAPANPTIAADGDGFRVVVRVLNWRVEAGHHVVDAPDGVFRTRNFVLTTDRDLAVSSRSELLPSVPPGPPVHPSHVVGLEDLRLVCVDDRWFGLAAVRDRSADRLTRMALCAIDGDRVTSMRLLDAPRPDEHEKNWVPFVHEGALHLVQSCAPTVVLRCDVDTGATTVVSIRPGPAGSGDLRLRGGSQALPDADGWIFVAHEVEAGSSGPVYVHRFVHLDRSFTIDAMSAPFVFEEHCREFCAGLAWRGEDLVVTYGVDDRDAHAAVVRGADVYELLRLVALEVEVDSDVDDLPDGVVDPRALFDLFELVSEPTLLDVLPRPEGRPRAGAPQPPRTLTLAMATFDDYDGVYFTVQSLRLHHPEVRDRVSILVLDNHPEGLAAPALKTLEANVPELRYVPCGEIRGTAVRDLLFRYATSDWVMVVDSHVLFSPGVIARLLDWLDAHPDCDDLLQGPALWDSLDGELATHFEPVWQAGMYGHWATDDRGRDPDAEPFEIPMQGLGCFVARRASWLGFNPRFSGFGGEEGYLHEKYRRAGRRALCLPFLRWVHRFDRPQGTRYVNRWEDRIANYLQGWREVGLDESAAIAHFREFAGREVTDSVVARLAAEARSPFAAFDAIFCITLDDERWPRIVEQAAMVGIADRIRRLSAFRTDDHHVGCALSHRRAIELADLQGLDNVLVLEDDVRFLWDAVRHLTPAVAELAGTPWHVCYLGGHRWGTRVGPTPPFAHLERPGSITTTHAIAYHRRLFGRLLAVLPDDEEAMAAWIREHGAIDQYLQRSLPDLAAFVTVPAVATQTSILAQEDPDFRERFMP